MKKLTNTSGFTLLEIIIVIIIVGVLASLALPRFFATVEFSRSTEAFSAMTAIRGAMERCYLRKDGIYTGCTFVLDALDLENPGDSPNAHFAYAITPNGSVGYALVATRNTTDGGDGVSTITVTQTSDAVTRDGTGKFVNISN